MSLTEILPSLQKLSHFEKVKAIQFLATELTKDEQISEQEWNEIQETLYIQSISGLAESIHQEAATPIEECIDVENIEW